MGRWVLVTSFFIRGRFGGSCFPKDTMALVKTAKRHGSNVSIVDAAIKFNQIVKAKWQTG